MMSTPVVRMNSVGGMTYTVYGSNLKDGVHKLDLLIPIVHVCSVDATIPPYATMPPYG